MDFTQLTRLRSVIFFLPSILVGCGGGDEYATVPVSGILTCQGKPVANATINFSPLAAESREAGKTGRQALGITDNEGRFKLTTYENYDGALKGRHKVTFSMNVDEDAIGKRGGGAVPNPCRDATMEFTVEKGMGEAKIEF